MIIRLSIESDDKKIIALEQLKACVNAGLSVDGYIWVYDNTSHWDIDMAMLIVKSAEAAIGTLWLDVEDTSNPASLADKIRDLANYASSKGQRVGIYTARWFWKGYLGDSVNYADLPLWDADYSSPPEVNRNPGYGGWSTLNGHQYRSDTTIAGIRSVDLNVFRA